jgi:hypothetical protein
MTSYIKERNMNWKYIQQVVEQAGLEATLEVCVQDVLDSNLDRDSGHSDRSYRSFPHYLQATTAFFLIASNSSGILPSDAM